MPKLLSGAILRTGGSGEFIALPGAQPALLPTPSTSTGFTLILDSQQRLSYSNKLGDIAFNSGTIIATIPNGNLRFSGTGTGTLQFDSDAFFNKNVTFANTFTFTDLTASGLIRFTNTSTSTSWNNGAVVISGSLGVGKETNLHGPLNVFSNTNFYTDVSISPNGYNVDISPKLGGQLTIFPDRLGYMDNVTIGYNTPADGWFNNLNVLNQFVISSKVDSFNTYTGALVVGGGAGFGGDIYARKIYDNYKRTVTEVDIFLGKGLAFFAQSTSTGPTVSYSVTNTGVTSITAGTGTFVTTSTGDVVIYTTGNTLQDVTNAGNSTTNIVLFQNTSTATTISSASVIFSGGVAIQKNLIVSGSISAGSFAGLGVFDRISVTSNAANTTTLANNSLYTVGGVGVGSDLTVFGNEFIYGSLTILGTLTTIVSQVADVGRKVVALSTSAGPAILAADSGITVGPIANPFAKFLFDGVSSWRSTGGINPVTNNTYNLGAPSLTWKTIYAQNEFLYSTTTSVSTQTGALVVTGGVGIGKDVYVGGSIYENNTRVLTRFTAQPGAGLSGGGTVTAINNTFTFTNTGVLSITAGTGTLVSSTSGHVTISVNSNAVNLQGVTEVGNSTTNVVRILNTTDAVNTYTGALIVTGGVGVGGDIYARNFRTPTGASVVTTDNIGNYANIFVAGTDTAISTSGYVITIWNTSTLQSVTERGNSTSVGIAITSTATSSNSTQGALTVAGGVGINGNLNVGGISTFAGPVTFNGTATFVYSTNTYYTDNLIELHVPETGAGTNWAFNDGKDIGIRFNYYSTTAKRAFLGRNNSNGYLEWISSGNETGGATFAGTYGTFKTGSIELADITSSTSISSGALIVTGGVGIGGDLWVGGIINGTVTRADNLQFTSNSANTTNYITFSATASGYQPGYVSTSLTFNPSTGLLSIPRILVTSTQVASSTQTGAVVIAGGLGVGDSLYATNIYSNGSQVVTLATLGNYGVSALYAGTDTAVNTSTGAVTVWNTSTLHSVTSRGATTTNAIFVGSATSTQVRTPEIYSDTGITFNAKNNISGYTQFGDINLFTDYGAIFIGGGSSTGASLTNRSQSFLLDSSFGAKIQTFVSGPGYQTWEFDRLGFTKFPNDTLQTINALKINSGNGYVEFTNGTASTNTATGAVKILGGLGVGGAIHAGSLYDNENRVVTRVIPGGSTYIGVENIVSAGTSTSFTITNLGVQTISAGTDTAVINNTGSVTVYSISTLNSVTGRGATTTNAIFVGTVTSPAIVTGVINTPAGTLTVNANTTATLAGAGALVVNAGGVYVGNNVVIAGTSSDLGTTSTNALYVAGGVGIAKGLRVQGPVSFGDIVTFSGTATYVYSTNTVYTDNLIELHTPPGGVNSKWDYDDQKDIGLRFHYYAGTDTNAALVLDNTTKYLDWYSSGAESLSGDFSNSTFGVFRTGNILLRSGIGATSTNTGDLQVLGGAGIGQNLYVGGNLVATGTIYGTVTNLKGGTTGAIPIQSAPDTTGFIPLGTAGYVLTAGVSTATWSPVSGLTAGTATNALNVLVTSTNAIGTFYPTFVSTTTGFVPVVADVNLSYDPLTDIMRLGGTTDSLSTETGTLVVSGGVGIGKSLNVQSDITVNGVINLNATAQQSVFKNTFGAITAGVEQNLDSWSTLNYRTAKYFVQISDSGFSPTRVHVTEISLFHDDTGNAYSTEYGIHYNAGTLGTFNASVSLNTMQFKFTPNGSGLVPNLLTVKLVRTLLTS